MRVSGKVVNLPASPCAASAAATRSGQSINSACQPRASLPRRSQLSHPETASPTDRAHSAAPVPRKWLHLVSTVAHARRRCRPRSGRSRAAILQHTGKRYRHVGEVQDTVLLRISGRACVTGRPRQRNHSSHRIVQHRQYVRNPVNERLQRNAVKGRAGQPCAASSSLSSSPRSKSCQS